MSRPTLADWRAQAEKELAGARLESLTTQTPEGLAVEPLYTEAPPLDASVPGSAPFLRGASASPAPFQLCMRVLTGRPVDALTGRPADSALTGRPVDALTGRPVDPDALADDLAGGADSFWLDAGDADALGAALGHGLGAVVEAGAMSGAAAFAWLAGQPAVAGFRTAAENRPAGNRTVWLAIDPIGAAARGGIEVGAVEGELAGLGAIAKAAWPWLVVARASGVAFHEAGADAADELALTLSSGVAVLRALVGADVEAAQAARAIGLQVAVGRDTFGELCKLRALRVCWHKVLAAAGAPDVAPRPLHAVCSTRTQTQRDPWVNMLRGTTQVFAAALGGADLVTPLAFDEALGAASPLGRRVARNTALVLREESHLGRVVDPAGGSYYLEARTEALAREAWSRFNAIEREGGVVRALASGALRARLEAAWNKRAAAIAKRKEAVLGVSEFANLGEQLPAPVPAPTAPPAAPALVPHRDAEAFEALRARAERRPRQVTLATLGPPGEHRARLGYAQAFFGAAGLATRTADAAATDAAATGAGPDEIATSGVAPALAPADVVCLCGSDERYVAEAVERSKALRAGGARRIVLAGRPGALEADLRAAGVDGFIFVGCDVVATLGEILGDAP